jgi:hypothetical protein
VPKVPGPCPDASSGNTTSPYCRAVTFHFEKHIYSMRKTIIITISILLCNSSFAEYRPLELFEMIIKADKIVYGKIDSLNSNDFILKIEGSLTNDTGFIKVRKFENWEDASRWSKYKIGQKVFLFLKEREGENFVMSGGNEGELPIVGNDIYISGFSIPLPPPQNMEMPKKVYFETEHFKIYGGEFWGAKLDFFGFLNTVSEIRRCFDFEYGMYNLPSEWKLKCDIEEITEGKNKILIWTYEEMERYKNER